MGRSCSGHDVGVLSARLHPAHKLREYIRRIAQQANRSRLAGLGPTGDHLKRLVQRFGTPQAFARLPHESAQYVEVLVEISWNDDQKLRKFALTSTMPRNDAEGFGS